MTTLQATHPLRGKGLYFTGVGLALAGLSTVLWAVGKLLIVFDDYQKLQRALASLPLPGVIGVSVLAGGIVLAHWARNHVAQPHGAGNVPTVLHSIDESTPEGRGEAADRAIQVQVRCRRCNSFNVEGTHECKFCGKPM